MAASALVAAGAASAASPATAPYTYWDLGVGSYMFMDINAAGQVASGRGDRAILWNGPPYGNGRQLSTAVSQGTGINDAGQIVGWRTIDGQTRGTLWNAGVPTDLGSILPYSINANGVIAGVAGHYGAYMAVVQTAGVWTVLDTLGGGWDMAFDVNLSGQAAGQSRDPKTGNFHAVLWSGAKLTDLGAGGGASYSYDINDAGTVVGTMDARPTKWVDARPIALTAGNGCCGVAFAINNLDQVVGSVSQPNGQNHAMLWTEGTTIDLNQYIDPGAATAGWYLADAFAVNDSGSIVGVATNRFTRDSHLYVLSTAVIPEPSTAALLIGGVALLAAWGRPRSRRRA